MILKGEEGMKKAFILTEVMVSAFIIVFLLSLELRIYNTRNLAVRRDWIIINSISSRITEERINALSGKTRELVFPGKGRIGIRTEKGIKYLDTGGLYVSVNNEPDYYQMTGTFKLVSRTYGNNGFTIVFERDGQERGRFIFSVGTSSMKKIFTK